MEAFHAAVSKTSADELTCSPCRVYVAHNNECECTDVLVIYYVFSVDFIMGCFEIRTQACTHSRILNCTFFNNPLVVVAIFMKISHDVLEERINICMVQPSFPRFRNLSRLFQRAWAESQIESLRWCCILGTRASIIIIYGF